MVVSYALAGRLISVTVAPHQLSTASTTATGGTSVSTWIPVAAAVIAALAAVGSALLQRKTGKEATKVSGQSAAAAQASSEAANRSAKAAEAAGARADAAALAARYQDAASQLGHDKAAVRLAGVYAMSRLADDWLEERQTCIDVLCAYLRLPWQKSAKSNAADDEAQVRRTIASVINRHVAADATVSWAVNDFDFTRAELRDFVLEGCVFAGEVTFSRAQFIGECVLDDIAFDSGASFAACAILGHVKLKDVRTNEERQITFAETRLAPDAELEVMLNSKDPRNARRWVDFSSMAVQGKLKIGHISSFFRQPPLDLDLMELDGGCVEMTLPVSLTKDHRPRYPHKIMARDWEISSGSRVLIPQEFIDDGTVEWGTFFKGRIVIPPDVTVTFKLPTTDL